MNESYIDFTKPEAAQLQMPLGEKCARPRQRIRSPDCGRTPEVLTKLVPSIPSNQARLLGSIKKFRERRHRRRRSRRRLSGKPGRRTLRPARRSTRQSRRHHPRVANSNSTPGWSRSRQDLAGGRSRCGRSHRFLRILRAARPQAAHPEASSSSKASATKCSTFPSAWVLYSAVELSSRHYGRHDCCRSGHGNTVVLKPSSETPTIAAEFAEVLLEAGFRPKHFRSVSGSGAAIGDTLVSHPKTRFVSLHRLARSRSSHQRTRCQNPERANLD